MIDFVLCIRFWLVRKCLQTAVVIFDSFPIYQLTFLRNCFSSSRSQFFKVRDFFLLQALKLKHFVFDAVFGMNWLICSLNWHHDNPRMPRCSYWKIPKCRVIFLHKKRLETFHEGGSRSYFLDSIGLKKKYHFSFCIALLMDNKFQDCLWYGLFSNLELLFLQSNFYFFQGFYPKPCFWKFLWTHWFYSVQLNPYGSEMLKNAITLDVPGYSNSFFFSALPSFVFPSRSQSSFFAWDGIFVS